MNDCNSCPVEKECHYPYKPCDCVYQRKFWDKERREKYDNKDGLNNPITPNDVQNMKDNVINFNFGR